MSIDGSQVENGAMRGEYPSPFSLDNRPTSMAEISSMLQYQGSVGSVLDGMQELLTGPKDASKKDNFLRALYPPRLLRGVMDYKIAHSDMQHPEALIEQAVKMAVGLYQEQPSAIDQLTVLRAALAPDMLTGEVKQTADLVSYFVTTPENLAATTQELRSKTLGRDILMISLGHGGIPGGLDIFSRYTWDNEQTASTFYPVRFSQHKHGDTTPALTESESTYLKAKVQGKQVVVFDEDRGRSKTLETAGEFFTKALGKPVLLLSTHKPQNV